MKCIKCGYDVLENMRKCPNCGYLLSKMKDAGEVKIRITTRLKGTVTIFDIHDHTVLWSGNPGSRIVLSIDERKTIGFIWGSMKYEDCDIVKEVKGGMSLWLTWNHSMFINEVILKEL